MYNPCAFSKLKKYPYFILVRVGMSPGEFVPVRGHIYQWLKLFDSEDKDRSRIFGGDNCLDCFLVGTERVVVQISATGTDLRSADAHFA